MPFVQLKGVGGYLTGEQKTDFISKLTDAVVAVYGEGLRQATWVAIEEAPPGAWGAAGQPVTEEAVRDLAATEDVFETPE